MCARWSWAFFLGSIPLGCRYNYRSLLEWLNFVTFPPSSRLPPILRYTYISHFSHVLLYLSTSTSTTSTLLFVMAPSHRRGPWVPEEDQLLLQLVREQGPNNWVRISQHMHYRSPKQCRERFHQNLKPSLNREPISADEGLMIERMVNEMGKRWAEIARRLGNRSDNAVKNWWNGSMNRKRRGLSTPTLSRAYTSRVEAPYPRASALSPSRPRFSTRPWAESAVESAADSYTRRDSMTTRQLSPIYTLPSINRPIDAPLTSPAFSEASNATSVEPPSMVSDHNSVSSSPRTLPSPQMLPLPIDIRSQYDARRQSVASVQVVDNSPNYPARALESLSDIASKRPWMEHYQPTLASWHQPSDTKSWESRAEEPKDNRIGVNSLLN